MARTSKKPVHYPIITSTTSISYTNAPTAPRPNRIPPIYLEELTSIWKIDKRIPTPASRRAWARARNLSPGKVNNWWYRKKTTAKKNGMVIPQDTYELPVGIPAPSFLPNAYTPYTHTQSLPPSSPPPPETPQVRRISVDVYVKKEDPYQEAADHAALLSDDSKFGQTPGPGDCMHPSSDSSSDALGSIVNSDDYPYEHYQRYHDHNRQFSNQFSFATQVDTFGRAVNDDFSFYSTPGTLLNGKAYVEEKYAYRPMRPVDLGNSASSLHKKSGDGDNPSGEWSSDGKFWLRSPVALARPVPMPILSPLYTTTWATQATAVSVSLPFSGLSNRQHNHDPSWLVGLYADAQKYNFKASVEDTNPNAPPCNQGNSQQSGHTSPPCGECDASMNISELTKTSDDSEPTNSIPPLSLPVEEPDSSEEQGKQPSVYTLIRDPNTFSWCLGGGRYSYDGFFTGYCECSNRASSTTADTEPQNVNFKFKKYRGCTGPWESFSAPEME